MKEGIAPPLTTTGQSVAKHLPSSQNTAQGNYKDRAGQHCQLQAFFTMLRAWHGPASSFSGTCGTRNRIRSVVMAGLSGWEQGGAGSVMKMLGISKAAPPCLPLPPGCVPRSNALGISLSPCAIHSVCQCYTGESSHTSHSLIIGRAWNAEKVPLWRGRGKPLKPASLMIIK